MNIIDKKTVISADFCELCELGIDSYKDMCNKYCIDGYKSTEIRLGLVYDNKIVEVLGLNKVRDKNEYEIVRDFCLFDYRIENGFKKLLEYFCNKYDCDSISINIDLNLINTVKYEENGFEIIGYNGPNQFFIKADHSYKRIKMNPNRYKEFKLAIEENKIWECYGVGSLRLRLDV